MIKFILGLIFFSQSSWACNPYLTIGSPFYNPMKMAEYNEFKKENQKFGRSGLSQVDYNEVLNKVSQYYSPIVAARGATLDMDLSWWSENVVNAYARQLPGNIWAVWISGGLARHSLSTKDTLLLTACHEMGHHFGETNYYPAPADWASGEGQSDYYATSKCMRHILQSEDNETYLKDKKIPSVVKNKCESQFTSRSDQLICIRSTLAAIDEIQIYENGQSVAKIDQPSQAVAITTSSDHPEDQCRLDTSFQGALCEIDSSVFPVKGDHRIGNCNISTQHTIGYRPECWFNESNFL